MSVGGGGVANFVYTTNAIAKGVAAVINAGRSVIANLFDPRWELFSSGEQGLWYDLNDDSTIFQDSAGTTLASWGDPVGLVLDESRWDGRGVVNRLIHTNAVTQAAWSTSIQITRPSANVIVETSVNDAHALSQPAPFTIGVAYTQVVSLQKGTLATAPDVMQLTFGSVAFGTSQFATVNVVTGAVLNTAGGAICTALGADPDYAGAWRFSYTATATATATTSALGVVFCQNNPTNTRVPSYAGSTTADCRVYKCQSQIGSTATAYQANGASVGGAGNHAIQSTAGSRPIRGRMPKRGRVNLLVSTGNLNGTGWTRNLVTVLPSTIVAPDGTTTADRIYPNSSGTGANRFIFCQAANASSISTATATLAPAGKTAVVFYGANGSTVAGYVNLTTGVASSVAGGYTITTTSKANSFYEIVVTSPAATNALLLFAAVDAVGSLTITANGTDGIAAWRPQLETGSTATAYQHVIDSLGFNVTESGQPSCGYLSFNGSNQWMQTAASVNFSATDEMSVFAGVRKVSDAARGILMELGNLATPTLGSFMLNAPRAAAANASYGSYGTTGTAEATAASITAPISFVCTGLSEIASDTSLIRVNGTQRDSSATDQGTGNYGNYVTYFGARAGTSLYFNGLMFSTIVRGALTSGTLLTRTEQYVARQTPTVNL